MMVFPNTKGLLWVKDLMFPLFLAIGLGVISYYVYQQQGVVAHYFANSVWFLWSWLSLFLSSCVVTTIGVILRKLKKPAYLWFEYPGSITVATSCFVYAAILVLAGAGPAALSIAVTSLLGFHFLFNFIIIHRLAFSK